MSDAEWEAAKAQLDAVIKAIDDELSQVFKSIAEGGYSFPHRAGRIADMFRDREAVASRLRRYREQDMYEAMGKAKTA